MQKAAVFTGKELGAVVGRLERETRVLAERGDEIESAARRRSANIIRRAARGLEKLAKDLEKASKRARR
jgi:hypothetical protein